VSGAISIAAERTRLMANRKRKGRDVTGWLCLDKAAGQTSTQAVAAVKRLFGAARVGHAGTLDPLATGALPIALGDATKTVHFVQDGRKVYRFTLRWGVETDTDDGEGKPVRTSDQRPDRMDIETLLPDFTGEIVQRPPVFSAIKIDGARAYDLAREGEAVVPDERRVAVHRLALVDIPDRDHAVLEAESGKGTYVRALARDLGRRLGCFGHVVALRRHVVGPFDEDTMVTLDRLAEHREEGGHAALDALLKPVGFVLGELPEVALTPDAAARLRRGQSVLIRGRDAPSAGAAHATCGGVSVAIGEIEQGAFHPKRVFR
jgi:tRNA pseudouridine55 synthase